MKMTPKVFVITAVHNSILQTKKFLKSLIRQNYLNTKVIVVDDGSTDGTKEFIVKNYPKIILLKGDGNLWWTGGLNKALEYTSKIWKKGDYVLTINNDCEFDKSFIGTLAKVSEDNGRAIVGSLETSKDEGNKIMSGVLEVDWDNALFKSIGPKTISEAKKYKKRFLETDTLQTKGTLFPIEVFEKIGFLNDKQLPHYASDYEFAMRAKRNGFKLLVSLDAVVYSDIKSTGITDTGKSKISYKELFKLLFSRKSQVNIVDHLNLVNLAFPKRNRIKNYIFLVKKAIYFTFRLEPFYTCREIFNKLVKR